MSLRSTGLPVQDMLERIDLVWTILENELTQLAAQLVTIQDSADAEDEERSTWPS